MSVDEFFSFDPAYFPSAVRVLEDEHGGANSAALVFLLLGGGPAAGHRYVVHHSRAKRPSVNVVGARSLSRTQLLILAPMPKSSSIKPLPPVPYDLVPIAIGNRYKIGKTSCLQVDLKLERPDHGSK